MGSYRHRLIASETSGRFAAPEFATRCSLSKKVVLTDEIEASAVSGLPVARVLLKKSAISRKLAEPEHFGRCVFTKPTKTMPPKVVELSGDEEERAPPTIEAKVETA